MKKCWLYIPVYTAEHLPYCFQTDQTVFDLLICPLDRRDNRDDRRDSDNDSEHGQKGTHLVRPDALKGQSYIFKQLFFLLYECDDARAQKVKRNIRNPLRYLLMNAVASRSVSGQLSTPTDISIPPHPPLSAPRT